MGSKHTLPKSMDILWCSFTFAPQGCSDCHSNYTPFPPLPVLRGQKGFFNQCSVDGWLLDTPTTSWPQTNHRQPACTCSQTHKPAKPGRPKVASNGVPTKKISRYVNYTLKQPLTLEIHHQLPQQFQTLRYPNYTVYQLAVPWSLLMFPPNAWTHPITKALQRSFTEERLNSYQQRTNDTWPSSS